ncbi:MAG: ABC transporter ATP-binding protein [Arenicellales bacterium]|nr:ABC transporter ATP-binding protein [Arenicellales bacterium]
MTPSDRRVDGLRNAIDPPAVELININKRFGSVQANRNVSLSIAPATIHGIVGENGAGKSTLMSILFGFYQANSGEIRVNGKTTRIRTTEEAIRAGIGMVHQHFMLVDSFTVLENVVLGAESGRLLKESLSTARQTLDLLESKYGLEVNVDTLVGDLPVGLQQRVEILKALYREAQILILDEPTGVLTPQESEQLFNILLGLRDRGVTVILITHKLREIMAITDTVTVMRGGEVVAHRTTSQTSEPELAELMVGRKVLLRVEKGISQPGSVVLDVREVETIDQRGVKRLHNVSFNVRSGEIVGIAGVSGNGQSELLEVLAGIRTVTAGRISLNGKPLIDQFNPRDAGQVRGLGVGHVPEDRLRMGLVRSFEAMESSILGIHSDRRFNAMVFMKLDAVLENCRHKMEAFDVRPRNPHLVTVNFSGGNQQKLVLAREMDEKPGLLLVGQPTRGVDIGAIEFIHKEIVAMRDAGRAVLLVSVELEEIMSLADRILVMFDGHIVGEVTASHASEQELGLMMANAATPASAIRS